MGSFTVYTVVGVKRDGRKTIIKKTSSYSLALHYYSSRLFDKEYADVCILSDKESLYEENK